MICFFDTEDWHYKYTIVQSITLLCLFNFLISNYSRINSININATQKFHKPPAFLHSGTIFSKLQMPCSFPQTTIYSPSQSFYTKLFQSSNLHTFTPHTCTELSWVLKLHANALRMVLSLHWINIPNWVIVCCPAIGPRLWYCTLIGHPPCLFSPYCRMSVW